MGLPLPSDWTCRSVLKHIAGGDTTNQYSDAGGRQPPRSTFSWRGSDRPQGQLSYTGSSALKRGGGVACCEPECYCTCVRVVAFLVPADDLAQCGAGNAVKAGGCHQHILPTVMQKGFLLLLLLLIP